MKKYKYVAVNLNKKKFTGTFLAEDEKQLSILLAQQNLYLVSAKEASEHVEVKFWSTGGKLKKGELVTFCQQFDILLGSGMSIIETLQILRSQVFSDYFKRVIDMLHEDVKAGLMLSEAIKKHDKVFPRFMQSMIYVGEMSGQLESVMKSLAEYYETDAKIKAKTKGAMTYPLILLFMTVGIVALMMLFVVPTFRKSLSSLDVPVPMLTQVIYTMSEFFTANWMYVLGGIVLIVAIIGFSFTTKSGKYAWSTIKINMPLFGPIEYNKIASRFARGFGLLMSSGLEVMEALEIIRPVLGNLNEEKRFKMAMEDIRHGVSMTIAFQAYNLFPDMLVQMISIGERSNAVPEVLLKSCPFFDSQVERSLTTLSTLLQPIMLAIMGIIVATLFIAIYSPMLSIMTNLA